jgi:hypothetical protein
VNAKTDKEVSVIIVSYNTADLIGACLASVEADQGMNLEVFVVDNASSDGSAEAVRKGFPAVHLVENRENRGFGPANNQVLSRCRGRYLVLLNPDTVVRPGAFREMASYMDAHLRVGLAGPRITNPDDTPQDSVSFRYPGQKHTAGELKGLPGSIACVMGACQIVRPELMKRIGGFDEDFFLYGEDQDLCLRIRKLGYEIGYIESAEMTHHGGKSERDSTPPEVWRKKMKAEYLFYEKHYLPGTIRRILKAHLARARWRLAVLNLSLPFARDRAAAIEKRQKYLALQEVARQRQAGFG